MNARYKLLAATAAIAMAMPALAGVSAEEAKALGSSLTRSAPRRPPTRTAPFPAYTGGLTKAPAGYKAGDGIRPNPFADEKPRLAIDAKNMAQHAATLTEGTKALLQKYPTFRVDVYPTHRSVAFPKFVADNTAKNAVSAKTLNDGRSMEGAHAGFPFRSQDRLRGDVEPPRALQRPGLRVQVPQPERRRERPPDPRHRRPEQPGISVLGQQQDLGRDLLAHQAHLHRPGPPRRRGADAGRPARHRHRRTAAPGATCPASAGPRSPPT
jgi:hypothetical protein